MRVAALLGLAGCVVAARRAQLEPPALDRAAAELDGAVRTRGAVRGDRDGRRVIYRNWLSPQTAFTDVRIEPGCAARFARLDLAMLPASLAARVRAFAPFAITCDGRVLRVQADRILTREADADRLLDLARDLARALAPR